jgi:hypothetical protein
MTISRIDEAPVFSSDRSPLKQRVSFDFRDYGFEIPAGTAELFEIVPTQLSDNEAFLFFFPREDIANGEWSLFNLHVFLKYQGDLEDFAHSRGDSVRNIALSHERPFGITGLGYSRTIQMADLFKGAEQVIRFIGGEPDLEVQDSHFYFMHQHRHCYTGMLHIPGKETRYNSLREALFRGVRFVS